MKNWKLMLSSLALAGVMAAPAATMAFGAEGAITSADLSIWRASWS